MRISNEHVASLQNATVIDQNGDKVGEVGQVYLDDNTGQPAWATVSGGLLGTKGTFVPLQGAELAGGEVQVHYTTDFIKDAPTRRRRRPPGRGRAGRPLPLLRAAGPGAVGARHHQVPARS